MYLNKKGFVSFSAIILFFITSVIIVLCLGLFDFLNTYSSIKKEVTTFSEVVAKKGGVTTYDLNTFKSILTSLNYLENREDEIIVSAFTKDSRIDCMNIVDFDEEGFFVDYYNKELIELTVEVPSKYEILNSLSELFNVREINKYYKYRYYISSKRYYLGEEQEDVEDKPLFSPDGSISESTGSSSDSDSDSDSDCSTHKCHWHCHLLYHCYCKTYNK